jgi:hypothetical protein
MAIMNNDLVYSPKYDVYVARSTYAIYKRNNRRRKTEITDDELVLIHLSSQIGRYVRYYDTLSSKNICISYIYADAFPELVENSDLHAMDPETYCELDHKLHVVDTIESNLPQNIRWVSRRINRADTSRRVKDADEKRESRLRYQREYRRKRRQDPEFLNKERKLDAERKCRYYHERKESIKQHEAELNEAMSKLDVLRKRQTEESDA